MRFSKTWQAAYGQARTLARWQTFDSNFYEVDTKEEFWLGSRNAIAPMPDTAARSQEWTRTPARPGRHLLRVGLCRDAKAGNACSPRPHGQLSGQKRTFAEQGNFRLSLFREARPVIKIRR